MLGRALSTTLVTTVFLLFLGHLAEIEPSVGFVGTVAAIGLGCGIYAGVSTRRR